MFADNFGKAVDSAIDMRADIGRSDRFVQLVDNQPQEAQRLLKDSQRLRGSSSTRVRIFRLPTATCPSLRR